MKKEMLVIYSGKRPIEVYRDEGDFCRRSGFGQAELDVMMRPEGVTLYNNHYKARWVTVNIEIPELKE